MSIFKNSVGSACGALVAAVLLGTVAGANATAGIHDQRHSALAAHPRSTASMQPGRPARKHPKRRAPKHPKRPASKHRKTLPVKHQKPKVPDRKGSGPTGITAPGAGSQPGTGNVQTPPSQRDAPNQAPPAGGGSAPAQTEPVLFAPNSVWNQPLASNALLDPGSAAMASGLVAEVAREEPLRTGPWITPGASIYRVGPNQPTVPVHLDNPTAWWRVALQSAFSAVPVPTDAQPGADADAELTVWQQSTDELWEFFHMRKLADGWHAAWGGAIQHLSQSPGYYNASSWPGALPAWGATASSLPHAAGVITLAEIQQGRIDHALAINLPYPSAGVWAWPAQRTDGTGVGPGAIPEGAHLRLDPSLNLGALNLPPLVYMMAKAAQKYGMIVRDQTHWAIGFWIEKPESTSTSQFYLNNVPRPDGPFQGLWPYQLLQYFPWSSVQVLNMSLSGPGVQ